MGKIDKANKIKMTITKQKLPTEGQSSLSKAVKNVKQILQTKNNDPKITKIKSKKVAKMDKRKRKNLDQKVLGRGIVYVGHIPHGFYEDQMKDYFKQFGRITRVRLSRSKETGKSRGYGYVEFVDSDVAKIAAETMNNYLMCGRLVKATYIPSEKQHNGFFTKSHWTKEHYPKKMNRLREIKLQNGCETKAEHKIFVQRSTNRLDKLSKKLKEQGIDLDLKITPGTL